MFIFKSNQKRANIYASYTDANGTRHTKVPSNLIEEIPDPTPPLDFSDETYYRTEEDYFPYVVYTKKSEEQLAALRWNKLKQIRDDLVENGGCLVQTKWFHTDTKSKQQQMALVMMGSSIPVGLMWKTMDSSFIEMTATLATELFTAQVAREVSIFAICEAKKVDTTPILEGWPDQYIVEPVVEPEVTP